MASNFDVCNNGGRFSVLAEGYDLGSADSFNGFDTANKKKRRISSGQTFSTVSFDSISIDKKLSIIFDELQSIKSR